MLIFRDYFGSQSWSEVEWLHLMVDGLLTNRTQGSWGYHREEDASCPSQSLLIVTNIQSQELHPADSL